MARLSSVCVWAILFCIFCNVSTAAKVLRNSSVFFSDYPPSTLNDLEVEEGNGELKTFQEVEHKMKGLIDDVIKKVLPYVIRSSADIRLSGRCMASIFKLVIGMQKLQEWAIRMVDATGKPPSGLFQGTTMSLGDFDECINVSVGKKGKPPKFPEREYFHGKYCTVECKLPKGILDAIDEYNNLSPANRLNTSISKSETFLTLLMKYGQFMKVAAFRFGVCIPSTCGEDDLSSIVATISKQLGFPLKVLHCQEKQKLEFKLEQTVIIVILLSIILVVLIFTAAEIYFSKFPVNQASKIQRFMWKLSEPFSAISNTKQLFKVDVDNHPMPILRGLFLITVVFNILGHTYLMYNHLFFFKYSSIVNYFEYMQQFSFTVIANGSNGVENYFFIAGFLTTFIRWRKIAITPRLNLSQLLLKPYVRMSFLQLIGIAVFLLLPLIGYGPFWGDFVGPYLKNCRERWWTNFLYIQNYWLSEDSCLYHTWVMAVVMQLYLISVIVVWLLIKKPNFGIMLIIMIVICGMASVGTVVFLKKLPGALSLYLVDGISGPKMWNSLFIQTFDHLGTFFIGLITGYVVAKYKHTLKLSNVTVTMFWCLASACVLAVIFGLYEYRYGNMKMESSLAILYAMLNRNVYSLFLSWFVIACITDNAGFVPKILSWKAFIPAYRLSFLAYIIHLIVIYYHIGILRERVYLSHEENIINYFGYLITTFILAYFFYIFFQVPYMYFESFIWKTVSEEETEPGQDIEKDLKYKYGHSNGLSLLEKPPKCNVQPLSMSSIKEGHTLPGVQNNQEKS